jgi:hypothetical protein
MGEKGLIRFQSVRFLPPLRRPLISSGKTKYHAGAAIPKTNAGNKNPRKLPIGSPRVAKCQLGNNMQPKNQSSVIGKSTNQK